MIKLIKVAAAGTLLAAAGCMSNAVSFCQSSIPVEQDKYSILADEVTGTCTQTSWLFFTFGLGGSGQRHAYRDALSQVPSADGLVSMAVDEEYFILVPLVLPSFYTTRVTGTPIRLGRND